MPTPKHNRKQVNRPRPQQRAPQSEAQMEKAIIERMLDQKNMQVLQLQQTLQQLQREAQRMVAAVLVATNVDTVILDQEVAAALATVEGLGFDTTEDGEQIISLLYINGEVEEDEDDEEA